MIRGFNPPISLDVIQGSDMNDLVARVKDGSFPRAFVSSACEAVVITTDNSVKLNSHTHYLTGADKHVDVERRVNEYHRDLSVCLRCIMKGLM